MSYDLVIRNGRVLDPATGRDEHADVALAGGRVARVAPDIPADGSPSFDASGCLVTPGLIDLHTHVFWGCSSLSLDADQHAPGSGTTTWVDAGTAGAANFAGFRRFLIEPSTVRIVPFLNVSTPGLTAYGGAHKNAEHFDADAAYDTVEANRDLIKGIKVLASGLQVGQNDLTPVRVAREVGEATGLPVMCHIGVPPPGLWAILPVMRPGDIITHAYKGRRGCLVIHGNRVRPEAWEARERGVLFDIGHGSGSFSWEVARAALEQGFPPDSISTDVHTGSINGPAFGMASVMSKFLHLGMDLNEVVRLSTAAPARMLGMEDEIGTLREGACGDVAVLRIEEGQFPLKDCEGVTEVLTKRLSAVLTVRAGRALEGI
ncbi:MAG: amidohydrolase/deacetylase family metallohydrolase [Anaerolineae bacterium]|jgi:dihydroorotase